MQILRFLPPLVMLVLAGQAVALNNEEARQLVREADFETVFAEHQASFNAGDITLDEFEGPYWAFRTTEPRVLELADTWLAAEAGLAAGAGRQGGDADSRGDGCPRQPRGSRHSAQ